MNRVSVHILRVHCINKATKNDSTADFLTVTYSDGKYFARRFRPLPTPGDAQEKFYDFGGPNYCDCIKCRCLEKEVLRVRGVNPETINDYIFAVDDLDLAAWKNAPEISSVLENIDKIKIALNNKYSNSAN